MAEGRVYRVSGIRLRSALALPELMRVAGNRADCTCSVSRVPIRTEEIAWFHRWRFRSRYTALRLGRDEGRYVLRFEDVADFAVSESGRHIVAHLRGAVPPATLRHVLLDQVLPLALERMGRMPIHASAVAIPGLGVVAFAGGPGSGKSTLAAALARDGCAVLSDDCLVIDVRPGGIWAIPSYPGVRLWADAASGLGYRGRPVAHYSDKIRVRAGLPSGDRPRRLRALFLLSPPSLGVRTVSVSARSPRDAFIRLLQSSYVLDIDDRAALTRLFHQLAALSERVPMAGLRLPKDRRRLRQLAGDVRAAAGRLAGAVSC